MRDFSSRSYEREILLWGGTVGFGLGAIIDVIIFHLTTQHHHLLSGYIDPHSYEGLSANVMYDGLFLAVMFVVMFLGQVMLWRMANGTSERFSGVYIGGSVLIGAGIFNVIDGTINHYVLNLHTVIHNTEAWNPHWVAVSLLMLGAGGAVLYWSGGAVDSDAR